LNRTENQHVSNWCQRNNENDDEGNEGDEVLEGPSIGQKKARIRLDPSSQLREALPGTIYREAYLKFRTSLGFNVYPWAALAINLAQ
jgi:hypothetical protein